MQPGPRSVRGPVRLGFVSGNWQRADPDALTWLHSIGNDLDDAGIGVGPMPDKVFVLHPLSERVDGLPMDDGREFFVLEGGDGPLPSVQDPDATEPPERIVRWHEYASRRNIPMFVPPGYASLRDALPGVWEDDYVSPPGEGAIYDSMTQQALFDILLRHTDTREAAGTAYFFSFWVGDPMSEQQQPNVLHGPLASWPALYDLPNYVMPPQNLWPDDHSCVMGTHTDSWATEISGSTS